MKRSTKGTTGRSVSKQPLTSLIAAAGPGTLVAMLRGEGLSPQGLRALLRPDSATALRGLLNERLFPNPVPAESIRPEPAEVGTLLIFRPEPEGGS